MRTRGDIDDEFPQGDPGAVFCRWCGIGRVRLKNALVCVMCDMTTPTLT